MEKSSLKVMVVDDETPIRTAVAAILRARGGYEVAEASCGAEAIEIARSGIDVAVVDMFLGDMDGLDVCRAIREHPASSHAAVIHMSGSRTGTEDKVAGLMGGADLYLVKPVPAAELVASVQALARRVENERRLGRSYDEAAAATAEIRRLGNIGGMTAEIVHNMRTPLAVVVAAAENLKRSPANNVQYAEMIQRASTRLKDYVTNVMSAASPLRADEGADLRGAVEEEVALRRLAGHFQSVKVTANIAPDTPSTLIGISQVELSQVLSCLVSNALDAIREIGDDQGEIEIGVEMAGGHIALSVKDSGGGMDGETVKKLVSGTSSAFTTKRRNGSAPENLAHGGHGLGMSYVRRILAKINGEIVIDSSPGNGSTFILRFPLPAVAAA